MVRSRKFSAQSESGPDTERSKHSRVKPGEWSWRTKHIGRRCHKIAAVRHDNRVFIECRVQLAEELDWVKRLSRCYAGLGLDACFPLGIAFAQRLRPIWKL